MEEPDEAGAAITNNDRSEESAVVSGQANKGTRKNYPKVYMQQENEDGAIEHVFPFLTQPDPRDHELIMLAASIKPWAANKETTKAWDKVANALKLAKGDDDLPLFHTVSGKSAKERFGVISSDMKKWMDSSPWRSGSDNEAVTPFVELVEKTLESYFSFTNKKSNMKEKSVAEKEKEQAETCMKAALGDLTRPDIRGLKPRTPRRASVSSGRSTPTTGSSTRVGSVIDFATMDDSNEIVRNHHEETLKRLEIKRKQQDLEDKKIDLERDRFEEDKKQKVIARYCSKLICSALK